MNLVPFLDADLHEEKVPLPCPPGKPFLTLAQSVGAGFRDTGFVRRGCQSGSTVSQCTRALSSFDLEYVLVPLHNLASLVAQTIYEFQARLLRG